MTVIGITGPTGAGKTTLLAVLAQKGFDVVDCDRLYDQLLHTDAGFRQQLAAAFGPVFLPDGTLDRPRLAARVFGDSRELERLNAIVYPTVCAAVGQKVKNCSQIGLAIDAINLIESGLGKLCTCTVAVTAPPEMRLRRIMDRDRLGREQAAARIAAQKPEDFYRQHCDRVLVNTAAEPAAFAQQVCHALTDILTDGIRASVCTTPSLAGKPAAE